MKRISKENRNGEKIEIFAHPTKDGVKIEIINNNGWSYREVGNGAEGRWYPYEKGFSTKAELLYHINPTYEFDNGNSEIMTHGKRRVGEHWNKFDLTLVAYIEDGELCWNSDYEPKPNEEKKIKKEMTMAIKNSRSNNYVDWEPNDDFLEWSGI